MCALLDVCGTLSGALHPASPILLRRCPKPKVHRPKPLSAVEARGKLHPRLFCTAPLMSRKTTHPAPSEFTSAASPGPCRQNRVTFCLRSKVVTAIGRGHLHLPEQCKRRDKLRNLLKVLLEPALRLAMGSIPSRRLCADVRSHVLRRVQCPSQPPLPTSKQTFCDNASAVATTKGASCMKRLTSPLSAP